MKRRNHRNLWNIKFDIFFGIFCFKDNISKFQNFKELRDKLRQEENDLKEKLQNESSKVKEKLELFLFESNEQI